MSTEKRNYGVDLLRIVSMYLVILLHILGQGGILSAFDGQTPSYAAAWLLRSAAFCAVNCYALITGFVSHGAGKPSRYFELWLQTVFYCAGATLIFQFVLPDSVSAASWLNAFFPAFSRQYWYFSAYTGLFFAMPLLGRAVQALNERDTCFALFALCALLLLNGTVGEYFERDALNLSSGFSFLWLAMLYCMGAFLRKLELHRRIRRRGWLLFTAVVLVLLSWGWKFAYTPLLRLLGRDDLGGITNNWLISYTSPTMIGVAVALLLYFAGKPDRGTVGNRMIRFVAPAAFGVYLFHVQPLVWDNLMDDRFAFVVEYPTPLMVLAILALCAGVFVVGVCVDKLRAVLFALFHVRQGTEWAERQLLRLGTFLTNRMGVRAQAREDSADVGR